MRFFAVYFAINDWSRVLVVAAYLPICLTPKTLNLAVSHQNILANLGVYMNRQTPVFCLWIVWRFKRTIRSGRHTLWRKEQRCPHAIYHARTIYNPNNKASPIKYQTKISPTIISHDDLSFNFANPQTPSQFARNFRWETLRWNILGVRRTGKYVAATEILNQAFIAKRPANNKKGTGNRQFQFFLIQFVVHL